MKTSVFIWALALMAALLRPQQAQATVIATTRLDVGASINVRCTIIAIPLSFGTYYPGGVNATTPLDAQGGISLNCTGGAIVDVTLGQGLYPAAGSTDANPLRRMGAGTGRLRYDIYQDTGRTTIWDNVSNGLSSWMDVYLAIIGIFGGSVTLPVYGRVPAGQGVPSGNYSDTVIATVVF